MLFGSASVKKHCNANKAGQKMQGCTPSCEKCTRITYTRNTTRGSTPTCGKCLGIDWQACRPRRPHFRCFSISFMYVCFFFVYHCTAGGNLYPHDPEPAIEQNVRALHTYTQTQCHKRKPTSSEQRVTRCRCRRNEAHLIQWHTVYTPKGGGTQTEKGAHSRAVAAANNKRGRGRRGEYNYRYATMGNYAQCLRGVCMYIRRPLWVSSV